MSIDNYTLERLVELLQRREIVVYLGPDLPESLTGVPGWPTLAGRLTGGTDQDWPDAATQFVRRYGKQELVDWLEEQLRDREPGPIYRALAALPVDKFICATYDDLLQKSIKSTRGDPNSVVTAEDLNFVRGRRQTVVKLLGEVSPGRRGSLLLTDNEIRGLTTYRRALLEQEVRPTLTRSNLLILGQDLHTDFFQDLYFGSLPQSGQLRRRAFAVWTGLEDWEKESWKEGNLTVVEAKPLELVHQLLQILSTEPVDDRFKRALNTTIPDALAKKIGSENVAPVRFSRYVNTVLEDELGERILDQHSPLTPEAVFRIRLDIGELSSDSAVEEPEPLPEHLLPTNIGLDVMVSSSDFQIGLTPSVIGVSDVAHGHFFLPADGSQATTPDGEKYLYFYLAAPTEPQTARARIGLYYRNHLVQSILLVANIGGDVGGYRFEVDFTLSETLTDLGTLPVRPQISIVTNDNGYGMHQIIARSADEAGRELVACTYSFDGRTIDVVVSALRKKLRDRVAQTAKKKRGKNQLIQDLRELAPLGLQLWDVAVGRCVPQLYPILGDNKKKVVIQISRPTTSNYTFPWSLIYDIPLNSNKKPFEFKICPLIDEWDEREKIVESGWRHCPRAPNGRHERDTLCPFGFWGYRYPIEQLSSTEKPVLKIPVPSDSRFDVAVALTQYQVNSKELSAHVESLRRLILEQFPKANLLEGKDYETVRKSLGRDLPLVYFYCHGVRPRAKDANTYLGVGKRESITPTDFTGWVLDWFHSDGKKVWDEIRPLIFINACHSVEINPDTLVSYLDAFIGTGNAAGIIGTEVRVKQQVAMEIAAEFYKRFLQGWSVDRALHEVRLDYLAHGNLYGLIYTPYSWADLRLISLETPIGHEDFTELGDFIGESTDGPVVVAAPEELLREQIFEVLYFFTAREREVLTWRYLSYHDKIRTREQVGRRFGVTRKWIQYLDAKALRILGYHPFPRPGGGVFWERVRRHD